MIKIPRPIIGTPLVTPKTGQHCSSFGSSPLMIKSSLHFFINGTYHHHAFGSSIKHHRVYGFQNTEKLRSNQKMNKIFIPNNKIFLFIFTMQEDSSEDCAKSRMLMMYCI
jgi:hypothetical protein